MCVGMRVCLCLHGCGVSTDHEGHPEVARYRGSLNEDVPSSSWSSPYAERNVSHSVTYTSTGKGTNRSVTS